MPWEIRQHKHGIHLPQIDWWLDANRPVPRAFVSHAHFDHFAAHKEIIATPATVRLMRARLRGRRTEHPLPFGQTEQLTPGTTITLHPAGHMLGSAQCLLNHERHGSLLYAGDFKLRPSRAAEPCAILQAGTLIIETTFGKPRYVFPPAEKILDDIIAFCRDTLDSGATPVLYAYSLGKSQEVLASLAGAQLPILLHPETHRITRVCESLGATFPPYAPFDPDPRALAGRVVICPPQTENSAFLKKIPARRTAMISGWAIDRSTTYRMRCDAAFPLSDHADYSDLLRYVELVRPRIVYTTHGCTAEFSKTLRDQGIEAWPLDKNTQLDISFG